MPSKLNEGFHAKYRDITTLNVRKALSLPVELADAAPSLGAMETNADRLARIRSYNFCNDLLVSPRFAIEQHAERSGRKHEFRLCDSIPRPRKRRFGRFKVLAHTVSAFTVNHGEDKLTLLGDLFAAGLTGVDRIVLVGSGDKFRLALWIIVFALLFAVTFYFIGLTIIEYFKYKTIVSVSHITGLIPLEPAITICNLNPFKNSVLCDPLDALYSEREEMCLAEDSNQFAYAMSKWKNKAGQNSTFQKLLNASQYSWSEISSSCRYERENCPAGWVSEVFVSFYRYGKCFCIFCDAGKVGGRVDFATLADPLDGLNLVLTTDPTDHIRASVNYGFLLMIHDRSRSADPNSDGMYVPVGMTTLVGLSMKELTLLPKPFKSDCRTRWPQGEPYRVYLAEDERYAEQSCQKLCFNYSIMKSCGCLDLYKGTDYQQLLDSNTICADDGPALSCRKKWVANPENLMLACNCPQRCNEISYSMRLSQLAWNTGMNEAANSSPSAAPYSSVSNVIIYSDRLTVSKIGESQKMSATSAFSTVGGFMNMFTGASFLLTYEVLSILMTWMHKVLTMKPAAVAPIDR